MRSLRLTRHPEAFFLAFLATTRSPCLAPGLCQGDVVVRVRISVALLAKGQLFGGGRKSFPRSLGALGQQAPDGTE